MTSLIVNRCLYGASRSLVRSTLLSRTVLPSAVTTAPSLAQPQPSCVSLVQKRGIGAKQAMIFHKSDFTNMTHHWLIERILATGLIATIPASFFIHNTVIDYALVTGIVLHAHWGLSGVLNDYVHGYYPPMIIQPLLKLLTVITLATLYYFNYNDVGITRAVQMVWAL